jgi:hypothetical protein
MGKVIIILKQAGILPTAIPVKIKNQNYPFPILTGIAVIT